MSFTGTPIEILALILIVISSIKIITISINPTAWLNKIVKNVYVGKRTTIIFLILALIVLYFLLQELTIVQILAVMLFTAFIFAIGFSIHSKELIKLADQIYRKKNIIKSNWLPLIIWIILLVWGLKELFF